MEKQEYPISAKIWTDLETHPDELPERSIYLHRQAGDSALDYETPLVDPETGEDYYGVRFFQGADLMPRTAFVVDLQDDDSIDYQDVVAVSTSQVEQNNHLNKVLEDKVFMGLVNKKYLYTTAKSSNILPFVTLEDRLQTVVLPMRWDQDRRILSETEMINLGDTSTADWFRAIDTELDSDKTIRDRVDERGKLTKQSDMSGKYVVQSGASGAIPCASVYRPPSEGVPFVADQTVYAYVTDNEAEAYYLTGILNSRAIGELIDKFQNRGDFDKRHIHKLPYRVIPQFRAANKFHSSVAQLAREMEQHARSRFTDYITDLNNLLHIRRRKLHERLDRSRLDELTRQVKIVLQDR